MVLFRLLHALVHRARHDVAGREVGERMQPGHERRALDVAQDRTFAAQRLGQQRARHQRGVQRRGVELDELEVGARDTGLQRERHAVTRRQRRIGGDRETLTRATRCEHDVGRAHELDLVVRAQREHAGATIALDEQLDREPPLAHLDRVADVHRFDQRAFDLGAGRVATRVHDPRERVPAFAGQEQLRALGRRLGVEVRAETRQLAYPVGTFGHEDAHRVGVAEACARGQRVDEVQIRRVGRGERGRDAALCVPRGRVRELTLGQDEHRQAPPRRVERSRQPRDATPQHEDVVHEESA